MPGTYTFTCPVCAKSFTCHSPKQVYCSKLCRGQQLKKRIFITCEQCGKEVETTPCHKDRKRYCSSICRDKGTGIANGLARKGIPTGIKVELVPLLCVCGKTFMVPDHDKEKTKYCSHTCAGKYAARKSKRQLLHCAHCGKDIWKFPSRIGINKNYYCSYSCKHKAQSVPEIHITLLCEHCGQPYETTTHQVRYRGSHYCSRPCMDAGMRTRESDKSFYWRKTAGIIRERDGYHCRLCGKHPKYRLNVHHIIPARLFGTDYEAANQHDNLISLCRTCHRKVESDPMLIQDQCNGLSLQLEFLLSRSGNGN